LNVLAAWLETHRFTLYNEPGTPTYFPDRLNDRQATPSVIDLALSRGANQDRILSWAIDEATPSDHCTIALYLSVSNLAAAEPTHYWNWRNADWHLFDNHIRRRDLNLDFDKLESFGGITPILHAILEAVEAYR
jgi:hypothetical protein